MAEKLNVTAENSSLTAGDHNVFYCRVAADSTDVGDLQLERTSRPPAGFGTEIDAT